jgi:ATP-dependent DNA helicase DinG
VSDQLEKMLWRKVPHVVITSATLRSLNSFARLQEMSGLSEKAGDRFRHPVFAVQPRCAGQDCHPEDALEPVMANEAAHLEEMARFFRTELAKAANTGTAVIRQ